MNAEKEYNAEMNNDWEDHGEESAPQSGEESAPEGAESRSKESYMAEEAVENVVKAMKFLRGEECVRLEIRKSIGSGKGTRH